MDDKVSKKLQNLQGEQDFLAYLKLLREIIAHYVVFVVVGDTGFGPHYTQEHTTALRQLGLQIDLWGKYRQPYLAVINKGAVVREKTTEQLTEPVTLQGKLNKHDFFAYSGGFVCQSGAGFRAMVVINGKNYGMGRGFNFVVYDTDQDEIVDCHNFDTYLGECINPNLLKSLMCDWRDKGVEIVTLMVPLMSIRYGNNLSTHEQFISSINFKPFGQAGDKEYMRHIYESKKLLFQEYHNTFDGFFSSFQTPEMYIGPDGSRHFSDFTSTTLNTRHGLRVTLGQPEKPKRSIFLLGNCIMYGVGNADAYSPASLLQKYLNEHAPEQGFIVHNYSFICGAGQGLLENTLKVLRTVPAKKGDIIIVGAEASIWGFDCCDLSQKSIRPHNYGEIFADTDNHLSRDGNIMMAEELFSFLSNHAFYPVKNHAERPASTSLIKSIPTSNDAEENEQLSAYKQKLTKIYHDYLKPVIGSIVMNCNPFTKGHRYLVEQALSKCDKLIVFVVEEDKSYFPFADRLELVKENLADLKNVLVLPSGQFILSSRTFNEYFNKESLQDRKIDASLDVSLFGREIAPSLDISIRFAGEEPLDKVTAQYNAEMRHLLRQYDVKFVEIPRLKREGMPISASQVRRLLKERDFRNIRKLVPDATYRYLRRFASAKD